MFSMLGDILEYHFLRQHATFGSNRTFMTDIRSNIEQNLQIWDKTLQDVLARNAAFADPDQTNGSMKGGFPKAFDYDSYLSDTAASSKVVLYGRHIWHCLHILLFGTMDIVQMYRDLAWQSSSDFVHAGEHALICAKVVISNSSTVFAMANSFLLARGLYHEC
jgi:xylanolytic transcriptional activator XlnR